MELNLVWEKFQKLPPERQHEVADFIDFLASRSQPEKDEDTQPSKISEDPIIGMWKDREDMEDPVEWVRKLRKGEWEHRHGGNDPDRH